MIRAAVRAVTLNVYHVGDDSVNRYITSAPHTDYFSNLVSFFKKQCMDLNKLISETLKNPGPDSNSTITAAVDEIEDNLYYFSDVISAGIPDVERLITDSLLTLLIFPLLLPSLKIVAVNDMQSDVVTSLYLLCCILRIVKIKDLANTIVAALYYPLESFTKCSEGQVNGYIPDHGFKSESDGIDNDNLPKNNKKRLVVHVPCSSRSSDFHPQSITMLNNGSSLNASLSWYQELSSKSLVSGLGSVKGLPCFQFHSWVSKWTPPFELEAADWQSDHALLPVDCCIFCDHFQMGPTFVVCLEVFNCCFGLASVTVPYDLSG
ncbi:hypothetical protein TSUD_398710 [Trifolium subterraneum]|uniref:FPL domain-containing protein n=1 Tax=Trifolium subterraneum TaxID=3900 RepID=A0A2Z6P360_TRISU|nr:hypothetical protein TSUD_398710 [Trifolium subterraneum]